MTNGSHILARGDTHLPFAQPQFGSYCAAILSPEARRAEAEFAEAMMGSMESGLMGAMPTDPYAEHDDNHDDTSAGEKSSGSYSQARTVNDL
jgi:hypothetical protein